MKTIIYKWAKNYVTKRDIEVKKRETKLKSQRRLGRQAFDTLMYVFKKKYLGDVIEEFKKTTSPQFKIGEIVTTNWYGLGSSWDGSMEMLQSHTPFSGPIDVEITSVGLDYCEIEEKIEQLKNREEFSNKYTDATYSTFKSIVDAHRSHFKLNVYDISWQYKIKVPGDNTEYWIYGIRENKLLKTKSDIAKWSKKCFKNEIAAAKLHNEKKLLEEKIRKQIDKITNTLTITR